VQPRAAAKRARALVAAEPVSGIGTPWRMTAGVHTALLRYAKARHDGAAISAWAQIAMANSSKATANRRFTGSSVARS
jgi:hypothetical protein